MPFVGRFHPGSKNVYVATGFGGWGMSSGVMSGQLLAATLTGTELPWAGLYNPRRFNLMRDAGTLLKLQTKGAGHFVGDRVRPSHAGSVEDIEVVNEPVEGAGAVLLLAFDEDGDTDGQVLAPGAQCRDVGQDTGPVVGGASPVEPAVALDRLERVGGP